MKRKILMCLLGTLFMTTCQVLGTAIYVENFSFEEPGTGKIQGWDRVPGWDSDTAASDSGCESDWPGSTDGVWSGFIANFDPSVYQLTDFAIPEGVSFTLKVDAQDNASNTPPGLLKMSLFYDDAGTRVEASSQVVETGWPWAEYTLSFNVVDVPESVGHLVGIEFENVTEDTSWIGIDNVRLNVDFCGIVYPPDGGENIPIDADLEWTLKTGFTCDVYFDTDPNIRVESQVIFDEAATIYDPGILDFDTTYYWRVDPIDPNNGEPIVYQGEVWSFTTMGALPYITVQPQNQTIPVTGTAEFFVEAVSPTALSYAWYKSDNPTIVLSTTDNLTITNIQTGDEGYYYCELTNNEGTVVSEQARLMTERLVGWWKFDGDATDSIAEIVEGVEVHDGILPADPNFIVDGIDGAGYAFFGDGRVIEIAGSSEYFNFYPQGMTVSVWVKTSTITWDGVVAKHYRPELEDWVGWLIDVEGGWCHFTVRGSTGDLWGSNDDENIFDGNWHLITGVMDPATQTSRIYVDGVERNESGIYDMANALLTTEPLVFGAETVLGQIPYIGQIDDVRIWSYPLGTIEIAMLYTEFNPGVNVCVDRDEPWMYFDVVGEPGESSYCKIDLEDFAELATVWMECNLVPECLP
jgi:hypothetical protein